MSTNSYILYNFYVVTIKTMADLKKLSIESWEKWVVISKWIDNQVKATDDELVDALAEMPNSDKLLADVQKRKLANKREKYKELIPAGFEYAPESAKQKWEELKNTDDAETMKWIQDNVSYNSDHTMNILKLKKTFCGDISWQNKKFTFEQAQELSKQTWYTLMTDYNDTDTEEEKTQTDWYKVINIFSKNKWNDVSNVRWFYLFADMSWYNGRCWTATLYKDENWKEVKVLVRNMQNVMKLESSFIVQSGRGRDNVNGIYGVCGIKDSI